MELIHSLRKLSAVTLCELRWRMWETMWQDPMPFLGSCPVCSEVSGWESLTCVPSLQAGSGPPAHPPAPMAAPPLWDPGIHSILPSSRIPVCMPYPHLCHGQLHQTIGPVLRVSQQLGKCSFEWWNEAALLYFNISVKILTDICVAPFLLHNAHFYSKLWVRRDILKLLFIIITSKTLTANIYWAPTEPDLVFSATHALPN